MPVKLDEERVKKIVESFVSSQDRIEAAIVVSPDGFPIYTMVSAEDGERAAAMGASFVSLAKRVALDLRGGNLKKVVVETDKGKIIGAPLLDGISILIMVR